jgi:superfamily II DNA or RNA helicase
MYNLREPQVDILNLIRERISAGDKKILVHAPTGFGKTIISYSMIDGAVKKGKRVLFTNHRIQLAQQSRDVFGSLPVSYLQGSTKEHANYKCLVATLQTVIDTDIDAPDIVIIDEVHYSYEGNLTQSLFDRFPNAIFIGLSATPVTSDGYLLEGFDSIVSKYQTGDLISLGWLTPFVVLAPFRIDLSSVKVSGSDYNAEELEGVINKDDINNSILSNYLEYASGRKFVGFGVNKKHCIDLCSMFNSFGVPSAVITSETTDTDRALILSKLKSGKLKGVFSIEILTAGFDEPTISCVILAMGTKSWRKYIQCAGRGIRLSDGKKDCILLDFCGNVEEHDMPDKRKEFKHRKQLGRVIDREIGIKSIEDNVAEIKNSITKEKLIYLKKISSLLDLYEGKIYRDESELQEDVNNFLKKTGYYWWRQNSGKMFKDGRWIHFASKNGLPDNSVFFDNTSFFFGLELKMPNGRLTDYQKVTLPEMSSHNIVYFICYSVYHVYLAIEHISKYVTITEDAVTVYSGVHNYPEWQKELRTKYKLN